MTRRLSDRRGLDEITTLLNRRRHPNDIAAALMLLGEVRFRVHSTGRRVVRYRRRPFKIVPKAEQQLRDAVQRCLTHGYELGPISRMVLEAVQIPLVTAKGKAEK